jgi:hypothetical protein
MKKNNNSYENNKTDTATKGKRERWHSTNLIKLREQPNKHRD